MNFFKIGKPKFIDLNFFLYLGGFYFATTLFLNDKLRAEIKALEKQGKRKETLQEIHDRIASSYEKKTENFEFRNQIHKYRRILISYAKGDVLECGVGTGKSLEFYKDDCKVIAIDHAPKMLEKAKEKLDDKEFFDIKNRNVELRVMDCEGIEYPEGSFDTVVDINNFQTYNDPSKVMENIKRVLKDNGILVFLARGESDFAIVKHFYRIYKPYQFMKFGQDLTINWENFIEKDGNWEVLFKQRKNYGRTYIYVLKLHKENNKLI
jgi:ubiquinone/menaquinone biosynthesis C-methylase UbiE